MKDRIKIGLVGAGHLGRFHLKNLLEIESFQVSGFYDINPERSQDISKEFGISAFDSLEALLDEVEAVTVATPTITHYEVGRQALEKGLHLFVEKPFTTTLEEAEHLISIAMEKGLILQVGHIERYNPALSALHDLSVNPLFIESHRISSFPGRGTDVPVILDLMIHDIDIILALVKSQVKSIQASGVPVLTDSVDIANARLLFENGAVANITASRISHRQMRKLRIFQPMSYISIDFLSNSAEIYTITPVESEKADGEKVLQKINKGGLELEIRYRQVQSAGGNALREELRAFAKSILEGTPPPVSGEDGKRALEIALKIDEEISRNFPESFLPSWFKGIPR